MHEYPFFFTYVRVLGVFSHGFPFLSYWCEYGVYFGTEEKKRRIWEWIFRIFVQDSNWNGVKMSAMGKNGNVRGGDAVLSGNSRYILCNGTAEAEAQDSAGHSKETPG